MYDYIFIFNKRLLNTEAYNIFYVFHLKFVKYTLSLAIYFFYVRPEEK